ncbi:MAG TPA: MopE-related protein, partial [Myxococcota bacterium]|nr:MopE-related protein [Myxococcota bacterium]
MTSTAGCTGPNDVIAKRDFDQDLYAPAGAASCCFVSPSGPASTFALIGYTQPTTLLTGDDCEDTVSGTNPGATEICDAADNDEDCDTLADDADSSVSAGTKTTWYADTDSDTWGSSTSQSLCNQPSGHVARSGDCIDGDASVYPGVAELQGSGGVACSTVSGSSTAPFLLACCMEDDDSDGWGDGSPPTGATAGHDCDDSDGGIYPGIAETERSSGTLCSTATFSSAALLLTTCCMADADADGWGDATNSATRSEGNDCNDSDATVFPGSAELEYNTAKTVACST